MTYTPFMLANTQGSFRLFRLFGIDVFLHWSWLVAAFIVLRFSGDSLAATVGLYGSLFGIVVLHEFGHALACRSVGGRAEKIVLWPLGGVAYVQPPQRPGAVLWSIAAGPLVNVVLVPITIALVVLTEYAGLTQAPLGDFIWRLTIINIGLLIFNMFPIYPLDGGQIVWAILWFFLGRAKSLLWAARFGLFCAVVVGLVMLLISLTTGSGDAIWLVVMAVFIGMQAWRGILVARAMAYHEEQERVGNVLNPWER